MTEVLFRPATEDSEFGFVLKPWIRCFAKSPFSGPYPSRARCVATKSGIIDLLKRDAIHVQLACNPQNPDQLWGFVCYERDDRGPIVHFCYVKQLFRRLGVGTDLITLARGKDDSVLRYTYKTPVASKFLPDAKHRPSLARRQAKRSSE